MKKTLRKICLWLALPFLTFFPGKETKAYSELPPVSSIAGLQETGTDKPLYLEHSRDVHGNGTNMQYAGHRSHSSHRSHASHASHYSSSSPSTSTRTYTSSSEPAAPPAPAPPPPDSPALQPKTTAPSVSPPSSPAAEPTNYDMIKQGVAASRAGRYKEAIALYQKVIAKDPTNFTAINNLGIAQYRNGDWFAAQTNLRQAMELMPNIPDPHFNQGLLLMDSGEKQEAQTEFQKACELGMKEACEMVKK